MNISPISNYNTNQTKKHQQAKRQVSFKTSLKGFANVVEVEVNKGCNLSKVCSHCPNFFNPESSVVKSMDTNLFKKILKDLKGIDYDGIIRYHRYGEALLRRNLEALVKLTKKALPSASAQIYTNGTLLNQARLESLLEAGIDKISVTQYTKRGFMDKLPRIPDNLLGKVSARHISEVELYNRGGLLDGVGTSEISDLRCDVPKETMIITKDGKVLPCYDDYDETIIMGNVKEDTIEDIWQSPQYANFREQLAQGNRSEKICVQCNRTPHESFHSDSTKEALVRKHEKE